MANAIVVYVGQGILGRLVGAITFRGWRMLKTRIARALLPKQRYLVARVFSEKEEPDCIDFPASGDFICFSLRVSNHHDFAVTFECFDITVSCLYGEAVVRTEGSWEVKGRDYATVATRVPLGSSFRQEISARGGKNQLVPAAVSVTAALSSPWPPETLPVPFASTLYLRTPT